MVYQSFRGYTVIGTQNKTLYIVDPLEEIHSKGQQK